MSTIKPHQAAFLQSYMKLSYGFRKTKDEPFKFIDFPFTQKFDLDFILNNKTARSEGSGITSVRVSNKFNLATQVNSEINITYTFGSMKVLTSERTIDGKVLATGQQNKDFPYGFSFMKLTENFSIEKEALKIEYGRKVAEGFDRPDLKDIIEKKEKKEYLLSKFSQNFKFDQKGIITLSVSYYNFHDAALYSQNNIAVPSVENKKNITDLQLSDSYKVMLNEYEQVNSQVKQIEDLI